MVTDVFVFSYRMIDIAKSMGLTLMKLPRVKAEEDGVRDTSRQAALVLPLVKYEQSMERPKRKKVH